MKSYLEAVLVARPQLLLSLADTDPASLRDLTGNRSGSTITGGGVGGGPAGQIGWRACSFNGTADFVSTPAASQLVFSAAGTLEGWFYWTSGAAALIRDATSSGGWFIGLDSGGMLAYRMAGTTFTTTVSVASLKDAWHHYVATKSADAVAHYIDGAQVHTGSGAASTSSASSWRIMRNGTSTTYNAGRARFPALYDRALSAAEVRRHYLAGMGRLAGDDFPLVA